MSRQEIEIIVLGVLAAVLKCSVSSDSRRKDHPEWDSLKHIEVVFAIEDELNLQFSEDTLAKMDSVESIVESAVDLLHAA